MCLAGVVRVRFCAHVHMHVGVHVRVEQQLRADVGIAAAAVGVLCVFWLCALSVCCVSAVSQGNAWLPIQAGADPAVPS